MPSRNVGIRSVPRTIRYGICCLPDRSSFSDRDGLALPRWNRPIAPVAPGRSQVGELNAILDPGPAGRPSRCRTWYQTIFWNAERTGVPGRQFHPRQQLDYLEAPDFFHDLFGHIPMLAHHDFAEMAEHIGKLGLAAIAKRRRRSRRSALLAQRRIRACKGEGRTENSRRRARLSRRLHFSLERDDVERLRFSVAGSPYALRKSFPAPLSFSESLRRPSMKCSRHRPSGCSA